MKTAISLCSGMGGMDLAFAQAGFRVTDCVEINPFRRDVLRLRFPRAIIHEDIYGVGRHNLTANPTIIFGGFPCTPVSGAGKRKGTADPRWLWPEFSRIIGSVRPRIVFLENADEICAPIRDKGRIIAAAPAVGVIADLTALGYDCSWGVVPAAAVGAPHKRARWWCVAHTDSYQRASGAEQYEQRRTPAAANADGPLSDADEIGRRWQSETAISVQNSLHQTGNAALSGNERAAELHEAQSGGTGVALGDTCTERLSTTGIGGRSAPQITRSASTDPLRYAQRTGLQGTDRTELDAAAQPAERSEIQQIGSARVSDVGRKLFDGLPSWLERIASEQRWAAPLGMQPYPFEPDRFTDDTFRWKDRIEALGDAVCVPLVRAFAESLRETLDAEAQS